MTTSLAMASESLAAEERDPNVDEEGSRPPCRDIAAEVDQSMGGVEEGMPRRRRDGVGRRGEAVERRDAVPCWS